MNKLMALMIGCVLVFAGFAASAKEASVAADDGTEELMEALDYGTLVDTVVDENGIAWETYFDEVTNVLWTQTAGATKDAALDSMEAGGVFLETDTPSKDLVIDPICAYQWMFPAQMTIWDDSSHRVTVDDNNAYYVGYCDEDPDCRLYHFNNVTCSVPPILDNCCGFIESVVKTSSSFDYSSTYYSKYYDMDSGYMWNENVDDEHISVTGGYRYYYMHEGGDVACESEWDYGVGTGNYVKVAAHWFYACGAWHRTQTAYGNTAC